MLHDYKALGRKAAEGAIEAHRGMNADLRSDTEMEGAYEIAADMEVESTGAVDTFPGFADLSPSNYKQFLEGYFEALWKAGL